VGGAIPRRARAAAVTGPEYEALAGFRQALREFFRFSDAAAEGAGIRPRHYQALLAIRGEPGGRALTVGDLAARVPFRHHRWVGGVDRLAGLVLVARATDAEDRRRVRLVLTARGRRVLAGLAAAHRAELRGLARRLREIMGRLEARS
jgi:DNA-binding MarR family transcriptional regulator